jgi:hypothetical protein
MDGVEHRPPTEAELRRFEERFWVRGSRTHTELCHAEIRRLRELAEQMLLRDCRSYCETTKDLWLPELARDLSSIRGETVTLDETWEWWLEARERRMEEGGA